MSSRLKSEVPFNASVGEKRKARRDAALDDTNDIHEIATRGATAPFEVVETTLEPIIPHPDEPLGLDLNVHSQSWDTSFDGLQFAQPVLLETNMEPDNAYMSPDGVSVSLPMDSYIRVRRYSFHAASIQNAFILGVDFTQIKDHKCGRDRLVSPWVNQSMNTTLDEHAVVPDLSPGEGQKKHDHDLYIDCLPFKGFREKLLALRSVEPKIFDEEDFIHDLDYRDAMQCWGPTPWEDKSWEVQVWFLNKWWMITGGESGEMGQSSRWWRMFRGELV